MKVKKNYFTKLLVGAILILVYAGTLQATNYFVDPAVGNMLNDGSEVTPWSTLDSVFSEGKTFSAGDTIFLKNGDHGFPTVNQKNSGDVVMAAYAGHNPIVNRVRFENAKHWVLEGVKVYTTNNPPEAPVLEHPVYPKDGNFLVYINSSDSITISNCYIYSEEDVTSWDEDDWNNKAWNGIRVGNGVGMIIKNCLIKNVNFGINFGATSGNLIQYNTLKNYIGDGLRTSSNSIFEYNEILDAYETNGNHDDAIQGFASQNVTIRGNKIINVTAPRDFESLGLQGIGLFDGFFDNYTIENNLVVIHTWHGISLYGARNCKIINNTVVDNPISSASTGPPWISIYNHKDNSLSSNNIIRNNITSSFKETKGSTLSNNIIVSDYSNHFVDYENLDLHLKPISSAINTAEAELAPTVDIDGVIRPLPYDIGCYEFFNNSSDVTPPGAPTGFDTLEVDLGGIMVNWNPSPENDLQGYRVYGIGSYAIPVSDTFATLTGLNPLSSYTLTVVAVDSAGNESAQTTGINVTVPETGSVTSNTTWQTFTFEGVSEKGIFTVTFDAYSYNNGIDGAVGILNGTALGYSDLACMVRFAPTGRLDARNAGSYDADNTVSYDAGDLFSFRLVIDVPNNKYDIYVTPPSEKEITLGKQYDFRTEQAGVTSLNGWATYTNGGNLEVIDVKFILDTVSPSIPSGLDTTNVKGSSITLSWDASTDNIAVAGYNVYKVEGTDTTKITTVTETSADLTGLTKNTQYTFLVNAYDDVDNISGYSAPIILTTKISGINVANVDEFSIYPNPVSTSEDIALKLKDINSNLVIKAYDIAGKEVFKKEFHQNNKIIYIPANQFEKGMYILSVEGSKIHKQLKLIVK